MRHKKRYLKISALLLIFCLCAALVSCGSDTGVQQPTDQLTIYLGPHHEKEFDEALSLFKEKFPDVEVTVKDPGFSSNELQDWGSIDELLAKFGEIEEFGTILSTELMADSGPDLLIWDQTLSRQMAFSNDLERTVNSGVFADINPYIEADREFDTGDFVSGAFDAGVFGGKRYFVPLGYWIPGIRTTRDTLELWGIDMPEKPTWEEFAAAYSQAYGQSKNDPGKLIETDTSVEFYLRYSGMEFLDYENRKSVADSRQLKTYYDDIRPGAALTAERVETVDGIVIVTSSTDDPYVSDLGADLFLTRTGFGLISLDISEISQFDADNLIEFTMPQVDGKKPPAIVDVCAAIRGGSENQHNAYEFIKLLLSRDVQPVYEPFDSSAPVRADSIRDKIDNAMSEMMRWEPDFDETALTEQWIEDYISLLSDVEYSYVAPQVGSIVEEVIAPYTEGKSSYEECFEELERRLNFYASE